LAKAYALRSFSIDPGWRWRAQRWAKFLAQYGIGILRRLKRQLASKPRQRSVPAATRPETSR
ncbi:MAG: hypothetical protein WAM51_01885, partial [Methylovirgula sp.]